ncbi:MAG: HIT domain-containing protein [Candidatus Eremiobacteraeota bacterium]|nr:HIT domain-containing protein [Candidatus Eremiobacteraeota bacterium]
MSNTEIVNESACPFCKIFAREIRADEVTRTADALVFRDLTPQAPTHLLAIPKCHVADLGEFVAVADSSEVGDLFAVASQAGRAAGGGGYRIVVNEGPDAGQSVFHLHLHILAGRPLSWPPG